MGGGGEGEGDYDYKRENLDWGEEWCQGRRGENQKGKEKEERRIGAWHWSRNEISYVIEHTWGKSNHNVISRVSGIFLLVSRVPSSINLLNGYLTCVLLSVLMRTLIMYAHLPFKELGLHQAGEVKVFHQIINALAFH